MGSEREGAARVVLAADDDVEAALGAIATLAAHGIAADAVDWQTPAQAQASLFDPSPHAGGGVLALPDGAARAPAAAPRIALPPEVRELARTALLFDGIDRFRLFHRWTLRVIADPNRRFDPLDADRVALERMARAVRTAIHQMHAFVRFVPVPDEQGVHHIAFHEPPHHVVRAAAPFFVRRFASMRWSILTPRGSLHWNGSALEHGPAAQRDDAPRDAEGHALWLAYYRSTFNPARANERAMARHVPRRHWPTLPEAGVIPELLRDARASTQRMQAHTEHAARRLPKAVREPVAAAAALPSAAELEAAADRRAAHTALQASAAACSRCPLHERATQTVFGRGAVHARLMLVGEQPGDREDLTGRPFVGPAGELLQRAVATLRWPRDRIYATNAVKHFSYELRGKRRIHKSPTQAQAAACADWLERELALVRPAVILVLGRTAARAVLGPPGMAAAFGEWVPQALVPPRCRGARVFVVQHPSALLRAAAAQAAPAAPGVQAWIEALARVGGVAFDAPA